MTSRPPLDAERLAALIDGRLSEEEARAIRAELAASDDVTLGAFVDAVAIAGEAPSIARPADVVDIASRRRRWYIPAVAAAGIVAVALVIKVQRPAPQDNTPIGMYASALPSAETSVLSPAWSATRGSGKVVTTEGRAVRVGVLITDWQIAQRRGDSSASRIMEDIASYLSDLPGSGPLTVEIRNAVRENSSARLQHVIDQLPGVLDPALLRAGAWLEGARVASVAGDTTYFVRFPSAPIASSLRTTTPVDTTLARMLDTLEKGASTRVSERTFLDSLLTRIAR